MAREIRSGRYRDDEVDLLEKAVAPGDTALDLGANFGLYTFHLARRVGPDGRVFSFEAVPSTALALRRVIDRLGVSERVEVIEKAVGERVGTAVFAVPRRSDGSTDAALAAVMPEDVEEGMALPLTRVDDEVPFDSPVTFMKVDVEGAEFAALLGAASIIERHAPTILIEISPATLKRTGVTPAHVGKLLGRHGYRAYRFEAKRKQLLPVGVAESVGNVIAVHPRRSGALASML